MAGGQDDNATLLIHDCLNRGAVTSVSTAYSESSPTFKSDDVGGIAGLIQLSVTIEDCVTCGSLQSGTSGGVTAVNGAHVGGIVGVAYNGPGTGSTPSITTKIHNNYSAVAFVSGLGDVHRVLGSFNPQIPPDVVPGILELYDNYAYGGMRVTGNNKLYQTITGLDASDDPIYTDVTPYSYDYNHFITPPQSGGVYTNAIIGKDAPDYGLNRYDGSNLIRLGDCSDYWTITDFKTHVRYVGCGHALRVGQFRVCMASEDGCTLLGDATNDAVGDFDFKPILITAPGEYCVKLMMSSNAKGRCSWMWFDPFAEFAKITATLGDDGKLHTKLSYPNGKGEFVNIWLGL
ncbi:hypothetical protein AGMMS49992_19890 [Clostridia bacterium]|nr:hypothetical protein AGMMS49992_19890 [Clostridia bacterium]